jgi:pentatricopeptide repeat protein
MTYSIVLKAVRNEDLLDILARKLGSKKNIPFEDCRTQLQRGDFLYAERLPWQEAVSVGNSLKKLDISFSVYDETGATIQNSALSTAATSQSPDKKRTAPAHKIEVKQDDIPARDRKKTKTETYTELLAVFGFIGALIFSIWLLHFFFGDDDTSPSPDTPAMEQSSSSGVIRKSNDAQAEDPPPPASHEEARKIQEEARDICGNDASSAVKLYRIAISFNERNLDAWHGLLNCYSQHGMHEKVYETRQKMKEIFGEEVFSLKEIIDDYGVSEYIDFDTEPARITYMAGKKSRDAITRDVYRMLRRIASNSTARMIIVYALFDESRDGYMITAPLKDLPDNYRGFSQIISVDAVE